MYVTNVILRELHTKIYNLLKYNRLPVPVAARLRRRSAAARLLRLWVRIPQGAWMSVCCECCVVR